MGNSLLCGSEEQTFSPVIHKKFHPEVSPKSKSVMFDEVKQIRQINYESTDTESEIDFMENKYCMSEDDEGDEWKKGKRLIIVKRTLPLTISLNLKKSEEEKKKVEHYLGR